MVDAANVSVRTRPGKNGRWEIVTTGTGSPIATFASLAEARAAGRARAKRLRCIHIIHDANGTPIAANAFGGPTEETP